MITYSNQETNDVRVKLKKLYTKWYKNGTCSRFDECKGNLTQKDFWLLFDHTVRLGGKYCAFYNSKPLRIVFMGKENLGFSHDVERAPLRFDLPNGFGRHYKDTLATLRYIFSAEKRELSDDDVLSMYALTNLYSCAFLSNPDQTTGIRNTSLQKSNCLDLKKSELKILKPTVLLLRCDSIHATDLYYDFTYIDIVLPNGYGKLGYSSKHNCYVVESSHPSTRRHKWKDDLRTCIDYLKNNGILPN